ARPRSFSADVAPASHVSQNGSGTFVRMTIRFGSAEPLLRLLQPAASNAAHTKNRSAESLVMSVSREGVRTKRRIAEHIHHEMTEQATPSRAGDRSQSKFERPFPRHLASPYNCPSERKLSDDRSCVAFLRHRELDFAVSIGRIGAAFR